ncbi:MAG TPA: NAD(P)-dependent oxidoreductase [Terriglobia bacterium]|nr:NAD(P)-dependent oxidoreductase [Terriglobia bacterium]
MELGFIGLGAMGDPMARNLIKAGHGLKVYNRTRRRAEALAALGATTVETPAAACSAGVVATMLFDDASVESVVFGDDGILNGLPRGGVHISHATISTHLSRRLTEAHRLRNQLFLSAPVFGRPDAALAARLLVVAAGPPEAVERCRPALEAIGRKLIVIGPDPVAANTFKLGGNFLIASMIETLGEAFALLRKSGVDPGTFLDIMVGSFFQSPVYENYGKIIAEQRYEPPGFKLRLGLKDVRLMLAAGEEAGAPLPIASLIRDNLISGVAQGLGELDWSAVARVAALKSGLKS